MMPLASRSSTSFPKLFNSRYRLKMYRTVSASALLMTSFLSCASYPSGTVPPIHLPLRLEAATLSRTRSEDSSRSNWAKDNRTFRVNRPIDVVVLNCWVTATNEIDLASKASTSLAKSASDRGQAVDLVDDNDDVDPSGIDILQQLLEGRTVEIAAGIGGVVVIVLGKGP